MARIVQPSFAKGELSPALHGRVDTAAYAIGLATARNAIVHTYGGISRRPGTRFVGPTKDHTYAARLIPFKFKTTDQYMLEFGNLYMRVIRDGNYVIEQDQNIVGVTAANPAVIETATHSWSTGDEVFFDSAVGGALWLRQNRYTITVLTSTTFSLQNQVTGTDINSTSLAAFTSGGVVSRVFTLTTTYPNTDLALLRYTQSADVMTFTHKSHAPRELTRTDHNAWTIANIVFANVADVPPDITLTVDGANNSAAYVYQVTSIDLDTQGESLPGLDDAEGTISTPGITQASPGVVTVTSHPYLDGDEVQIDNVVGMTQVNGVRFIVANKNTNDFELTDHDGNNVDTSGFTAWSSAGIVRPTFVKTAVGTTAADNTIAWSAVTNAQKYAVYRRSNGIFGLIGETELLTFKDANISPDVALTPPAQRDPFDGTDEAPGVVGFYEQRQVYGGSLTAPDTTNYSQVGRFKNFSRSNPGQADDAIESQLASTEVNEIRHYVALNDLIVLTAGSYWRVNSGPDSAFTALTIRQKPQSNWGANHIRPVVLGNTILFIPEGNSGLRSLLYQFSIDGYQSGDMALFSNHLTQGFTIIDMCAQTFPDGRLYMVRNDGVLNTFSFDQDQEVSAWTHWDTYGDFESCARLSNTGANNEDEVYLVVKRSINGSTVRMVEVTSERFVDDVKDCFYVDSGLTNDFPKAITAITLANPGVITSTAHGFSNGDEVDIEGIVWVSNVDSFDNLVQPTVALSDGTLVPQLNDQRFVVANQTANTYTLTTLEDASAVNTTAYNAYISGGNARVAGTSFIGLDHLEAETLVALCDGDVVKDLVVSAGAITLPRKYSRVHIGLPYVTDIQSLPLEFGEGTVQGLPTKISKLTMRFFKSRGIFFGPDVNQLFEVKQRELENIGQPTSLLTGDKEVILTPQWQTAGGQVFLRHFDPLPMTLVAIFPDVELGDN